MIVLNVATQMAIASSGEEDTLYRLVQTHLAQS